MKKVTFLLATLLIGGMMLMGCKKDNPQTPDTPSSKTAKVTYNISNTMMGAITSDCFKYTLTYMGADGNTVTVNDVSLPWTSPELTVTLPFNAKLEGKATYKEEELPDQVYYGEVPTINVNGSPFEMGDEGIKFSAKNVFLMLIAENPDMLNFSVAGKVE